jgi:hypothetical protein
MLRLRVINNGDHVGLMWFPDDGQKTAGCRGFAIQRKLTRNGAETTGWLANHVGFTETAPRPPAASAWQWPIQRYLWWDYAVQLGDSVAYQVMPVSGDDAAHLALAEVAATPWSDPEPVTGQDGRNISAYFNRGIIASQWVARQLAEEASAQASKGTPHAELMAAIQDPDNALRKALGGLLRTQLVKLLSDAAAGTGHVYAALYELNDPEVLAQFKALGARLFLLLGNGAFKPPANDENHDVRADLKANSQVQVFDRMVSSGHFAHNKFIVFCDANDAPQSVWTGSTNTTETGLCTQANNGILINDAAVASAYLDAWKRLHTAGNGYPTPLIKTNSAARSFQVGRDDGGSDKVSVWFAATDAGEDMDQARVVINGAKQGVLFLFFNPGVFQQDPTDWTLLQSVLNRHAPTPNPYLDPNLYIRGVVNQEIKGLTDGPAPAGVPAAPADPAAPSHPIALYAGGTVPPQRLSKDVLVPANVKNKYHSWEAELKGASSVMIHSKVVITDPFGPSGGDDRLAQHGHEGQPRERRQPDHHRGQQRVGAGLRAQHHRDLPRVSLAPVRQRTRQGSDRLARPGRQRHLAGRPPAKRRRRAQVLARPLSRSWRRQNGQNRCSSAVPAGVFCTAEMSPRPP